MSLSAVSGGVPAHLVSGAVQLHPEEAVWRGMLDGWRNEQLSRGLAFSTVQQRQDTVSRFHGDLGTYPWQWTASDVDEFFMTKRAVENRSHTTLLAYQNALRLFMAYLVDSRYGWVDHCILRFKDHPIQICHEWNTARHVQEASGRPGKRPYTRDELQDLFDCADDLTVKARASGRKGWSSAFRTATIMKVAYAWGMRRNEARNLDLVDFAANPRAKLFGEFGIAYIRFGKAHNGGPAKRRSVVTLPEFEWVVGILDEWINDVRPLLAPPRMTSLWPTERGGVITADAISTQFATVRRAAGLHEELDFHSLRRSYVTHLVEEGYDAYFIQQQVGHEHSSTTSIYTGVAPDYRNKVVQSAMKNMVSEISSGSNTS
jgi:site-specific recombinase XerD